MQTKQIFIASLLKPVNDTRMYEKLGKSINKINGFKVNIVGFRGKIPQAENIRFYPLFKMKRLNLWGRLLAPWRFYTFIRNQRPDIMIIGTHELLLPAYFYSLFNKCKIIYDVRENYYLNILHGSAFPLIFRPFLAYYVRIKEWLVSPKISWFLLAEEVYAEQLGFVRKKWTYIPNAAAEFEHTNSTKVPGKMLFSGTIAEETGVFEAIELCEFLHEKDSRFHLEIVGFCPKNSVLKKVEKRIKEKNYIRITGGTEMVDHPSIVKHIHESEFGIISYHDLPQIRGKIPTKSFEYLKYGLTPIVIGNKRLKELMGSNALYLENPNPEEATRLLQNKPSPTEVNFPISWVEVEESLTDILQTI